MRFSQRKQKNDGATGLWLLLLLAVLWAAVLVAGKWATHAEQEEYADTLATILDATDTAIRHWAEDQANTARVLAKNPMIVHAAGAILEAVREPEFLINSPMQDELRHQFGLMLDTGQFMGYFIIGPGNINLASPRDENIGARNLLVEQPDVLARLWAGETALSRPLRSEVPLPDATGELQANVPTLFVGTPIHNTSGEVIAILTLRLDPERALYRLLKQGRLRNTGETYIFDSAGRLLSPSRFDPASVPAEPGDSEANGRALLGLPLRIPAVKSDADRVRGLSNSPAPDRLTLAVARPTAGESGMNMDGYLNYRGEPVVGMWHWDKDPGIGVVTELGTAEAYQELRISKWLMYAGAILASLFILLLAWVMRRARQQARDDATRWQSVFDAAIDGILVVNSQGLIQNLNPAISRLFGYTREELLGGSITMLMPEPMRDQHAGFMQRYLEHRRGKSKVLGMAGEFPGQRKDGSQFSFDLTLNEVELGGEIHFVGIFHDLSQRKEMEAALAAEQQLNADTLDGLAESIAVLDEHANIIFVNQVWRKFATANGRDCEVADIGANYLAVTEAAAGDDDPDAQRIAVKLRALLEGEISDFTIEYPCHSPDEERWFEMRASRFEHLGQVRIAIAHQDVSAQRKTAQALQAANERLRILASIAEGTHSAIMVTDPAGLITWVNDGFYDLTGYMVNEVKGHTPGELLYGPETDPKVIKKLERMVRLGVPVEVEIANYKKDGTPFWASTFFSPIRNERGEVVQHVAITQDMTIQRDTLARLEVAKESAEAAVEELAKNQEVLRLALKGAGAGYWRYDLPAEVMELDAHSAQMYGLSEETFIGTVRDWARRVHPDDLAETNWIFFSALKDPSVSQLSLEYRIVRPNGEQRYVQVDAAIERDGQGAAVAVYGLHFDLTERWRAQQDLLNAKRSLEAVNRDQQVTMQAMGEVGLALFWLDADSGRVIKASDFASRRLGYSEQELLTLSWDDICPQQAPELFAAVTAAMRDGGYGHYESMMVTRDDEMFSVEVLAFYRPATRRQPATVIIFATDITERKQAEADLILSREGAESSNRAKSAFLAAMSHEIRTPINGVVGIADLLSESRLDADQRSMVRTMRSSAMALRTIIDDILDFSKIEAGKLALEEVPLTPIALAEEVIDTLAPLAAERGVDLHLEVDPALNRWFRGDPVRIRQILFNLGSNAVKFSARQGEDKGQVTLRLASAPSGVNGSTRMRFSVIDNGIGISDNAQKHLFQPFTQAESSTTRRFGGTGLGLAISRQLAELMGGDIALQSKLGVGSTFTLILGLSQIEHDDPPALGTWDLQGARVVCIDFVESEARKLDTLLGSFNATPLHCTVADAVEVIREAQAATERVAVLVDASPAIEWEQATCEALRNTGRCVVLQPRDRSGRDCQDCVKVRGGPWLPSELLHGVAVALGLASPQDLNPAAELALEAREPPSLEQAEAEGQLILVAEDNETNREVMARQLALLGYAHVVGEDGVEALELWRKHRIGLVLTDCHMPHMDGYKLSAAIRADEQASGERVPIVAVTANALKGEAERCHAAGMDDYLTKPIELSQLRKRLHHWLPLAEKALKPDDQARADHAAVTAVAEPGSELPPVDPAALAKLVGDDPAVIASFLKQFVPQAQAILADLDEAYTARDADGVRFHSHKLKSSSRSIGAMDLGELCANLEMAGRNAAWPEIERLHPRLDTAMAAVVAYIDGSPTELAEAL